MSFSVFHDDTTRDLKFWRRVPLYYAPILSQQRSPQESHLNAGHLGLSGLQLRGHAMFSDEGLPIDSITLEYAWLIEIQVGVVSGRLTLPQVSV